MIILGIDPGVATIGFGVIRADRQKNTLLRYGVITTPAGIPLSHIQVTDLCTCCNPGYLFSHRASQGKRGNLAAFLMMRDQEEADFDGS